MKKNITTPKEEILSIQVNVLTWKEYLLRPDVKYNHWFRSDRDFFEDPRFLTLNSAEERCLRYILCRMCKEASHNVSIIPLHLNTIGRSKMKSMLSCLKKLALNNVVSYQVIFSDVTCTAVDDRERVLHNTTLHNNTIQQKKPLPIDKDIEIDIEEDKAIAMAIEQEKQVIIKEPVKEPIPEPIKEIPKEIPKPKEIPQPKPTMPQPIISPAVASAAAFNFRKAFKDAYELYPNKERPDKISLAWRFYCEQIKSKENAELFILASRNLRKKVESGEIFRPHQFQNFLKGYDTNANELKQHWRDYLDPNHQGKEKTHYKANKEEPGEWVACPAHLKSQNKELFSPVAKPKPQPEQKLETKKEEVKLEKEFPTTFDIKAQFKTLGVDFP